MVEKERFSPILFLAPAWRIGDNQDKSMIRVKKVQIGSLEVRE